MATQNAVSVLNRDELLERLGGDIGFLNEIADLFMQDCPKLLSDIRSAISNHDARALEHAAHTLKGSVSNFGAEPARQAALRLEMLGRSAQFGEAESAWLALETEMQRFTAALGALAAHLNAESDLSHQ